MNWLLERHSDSFENNRQTMLKFYSRLLTLRLSFPAGPVDYETICSSTILNEMPLATPSRGEPVLMLGVGTKKAF